MWVGTHRMPTTHSKGCCDSLSWCVEVHSQVQPAQPHKHVTVGPFLSLPELHLSHLTCITHSTRLHIPQKKT